MVVGRRAGGRGGGGGGGELVGAEGSRDDEVALDIQLVELGMAEDRRRRADREVCSVQPNSAEVGGGREHSAVPAASRPIVCDGSQRIEMLENEALGVASEGADLQ